MNLMDSILYKIKNTYKGKLDCEEQRADLFVYVEGNETTIKAIDSEHIYFEDHKVKLIDADVHSLAYIDSCI
jgi:hypothetical protein